MTSGTARLQVLAAALLFSTGGAAIKTAAFTGIQVSFLRSGIAAVALAVLLRGRLTLSVAGARLRGNAHAVRPVHQAHHVSKRDLSAIHRAAVSAAAVTPAAR